MQRINYIYHSKQWPNLEWNAEKLLPLLGEVRNLQGLLLGRMESLGFDLRNEAGLETLSQDIIKSSEIEGEILSKNQVRSSIARRLGIEISGLVDSDRNVDGIVDMMLDATQNFDKKLTKKRLLAWHSSLFPSGWSGMYKIKVGQWRDDSTGPMQVVSGAIGKEKVHFQAPAATEVNSEMKYFLKWINKDLELDIVIKAGVAHLWFLTIHPFEDGNGRIARAITDMILSKSENTKQRFYSMSTQIRNERKSYYNILEKTQKGNVDITEWLIWFLNSLKGALHLSEETLAKVLFKHDFWKKHSAKGLNKRQSRIINMLLDEFKGKLTSSKWAKINKCSKDTAIRDIQDLIYKNILVKEAAGGRSTSYKLK